MATFLPITPLEHVVSLLAEGLREQAVARPVMSDRQDARAHIPEATEAAVLEKSRRRCCLCVALNADWRQKIGQIAHINPRSRNNPDFNNLAWLCLDHHAEYDSHSNRLKNYQPREVRGYREYLYAHVIGRIESGVVLAETVGVVPFVVVTSVSQLNDDGAQTKLRNYTNTPGLVLSVEITCGRRRFRWAGSAPIAGLEEDLKIFLRRTEPDAPEPGGNPKSPRYLVECSDLAQVFTRRREGCPSADERYVMDVTDRCPGDV